MRLIRHAAHRDDASAGASHDMPRAGLRAPRPADAPTGAFVVVEMSILVIVVALAMVSVIVASGDDGGREAGVFALRSHALQKREHRVDVAARPVDPRRAEDAR